MATIIQGNLEGKGRKFAIVVSRFNAFVTKELLGGARDCFERHGVAEDDVTVVHVPGSFELAPIAAKLASQGSYDAIVALGAVIRGATVHFDLVAGETAKGIARVALDSAVPVIFGVLTTDTIEQAIERAGTKAGNKGFEAAMSALEMASLHDALDS